MARATEIFTDAITTAFGVVLGGVMLWVGWQGIKLAPCIENWLIPVVKIERVDNIYRDAALGCFTLHIEKLRQGDPLTYEFFGQQSISPKIGLSAYVTRSDRSREVGFKYVPHAIGDHWARQYCFKMPGTMLAFDKITVTGHGEHRRHPFWTSITPIPDFDIAPMKEAAR